MAFPKTAAGLPDNLTHFHRKNNALKALLKNNHATCQTKVGETATLLHFFS